MSWRSLLRRAGLGLLAGALLHGVAVAQGVARDTTTGRDTTAAGADTTRAAADTAQGPAVPLPSDTARVPKDTIKTPLARAEMPPLIGIGQRYHWNRDSLFASGAFTLLDLLERIPGITALRSGSLPSPQFAAYLGNPVRVRLFYDGVEIDPLDPRSGGVLDMSEVQLWSLEELAIERGADEVRVYMRSWRTSRTTPQTRTDVLTGDQSTNLYRGFFAKRFRRGGALQLGGQQYGTSSNSDVGGGDELALIARLGWAKGRWSIDASGVRSNRTRDLQVAQLGVSEIPQLKRTRTDAYLRASYGDPDSGSWGQLMVARQHFSERSPFHPGTTSSPADSADTTRAATEYVATGGFTRWGLRLSAANRVHVLERRTLNSLSARLAYERRLLALSAYADRRSGDTSSTEEVALRLTPLPFLALSGALTWRHGGSGASSADDGIAARAEVGWRVRQLWLTGGVLRRDGVPVPGLVAFDTAYKSAASGSATGIFGTVRGKVYRDLGVDIVGVRWDAPGFYRPQTESRSEVYLDTKWLSRFPSGNFGLLASAAYEYRQFTLFPTAATTEALSGASVLANFSHTLLTRVEIRILDAVIFWQSRYGIRPASYEYVPGFLLPRQRILYGVRWEFWN